MELIVELQYVNIMLSMPDFMAASGNNYTEEYRAKLTDLVFNQGYHRAHYTELRISHSN